MSTLWSQLKIPVLTVFISLLLFFGFVKFLGPIPFSVNSISTMKSDSFTVQGVGEATGIPETAQFSVGVTKTATTVEVAQEQTNTAMNTIIEELKKLGIEEKDIKTSNYNVNPNIDFQSGTQRTTGYTVSANLDVTIRDTDKANQALDAATKSGANVVNGVNFVLSDEDKQKLEEEARKEAIKNAKEKAESIANDVGIKLGKIINVAINQDSPVMPFDAKLETANVARGGGTDTQLQPGENKVTVTVSLSYETL